jgi:tagatose-1,6-bisphosphate aldolase
MRRRAVIFVTFIVAALSPLILAQTATAQRQRPDYLSEAEADQIRDADTTSQRIKLYVSFAEDRLKKFDYELNRKVPEARRSEILNSLLNGYSGCVDDGSDQIDLAKEKQEDIHDALKLMQTKYKAFLDQLEMYEKGGPEIDTYRDTLEDAIDGTKDALSDVQDAEKKMLPAPVRRKP